MPLVAVGQHAVRVLAKIREVEFVVVAVGMMVVVMVMMVVVAEGRGKVVVVVVTEQSHPHDHFCPHPLLSHFGSIRNQWRKEYDHKRPYKVAVYTCHDMDGIVF